MSNTKQPLRVIAIAALGETTRAIGMKGSLLWKIPGDLPRFKALTTGHTILMGQTTFDGIGHPLPNRTTIVLTHVPNWHHDGVIVTHTIDEALHEAAKRDALLYVVGGGQIYAAMLPKTDELLLTIVRDQVEGDTFFPSYEADFQETDPGVWITPPDAPPFRYSTWKRKSAD